MKFNHRSVSFFAAYLCSACVMHTDAPGPRVLPVTRALEGIADASVSNPVADPVPNRPLTVSVIEPRRWTTPNGVRVEHYVRNDLPVTHLRLVVQSAAVLEEPSSNRGIARWFAYLLSREGTRRHPRPLFFQEMAQTGSLPTITARTHGLLLSWSLASEQLELALRSMSAMLSEPPLSPSSGTPSLPTIDSPHVLLENTAIAVADAAALLPRVSPQRTEDLSVSTTLVAFHGAGQLRSYARTNVAASSMTLVVVAPEDPALQPMVNSLLSPIARGRFAPTPRAAQSATAIMLNADANQTRIALRFAGFSPMDREVLAMIGPVAKRCPTVTTANAVDATLVDDVQNPVLLLHVNAPTDRARTVLTQHFALLASDACVQARSQYWLSASHPLAAAERRVQHLLAGEDPAPTTQPAVSLTTDVFRATLQRVVQQLPSQLTAP